MFTTFQKKVLAFALTCAAICVIGAFAVLLLNLLARFLSTFAPVVSPLVAALILSIILSPLVTFISKKGRVSASVSCAIVCAIALALATLFATTAVPKAVSEIARLCAEIPQAVDTAAQATAERFPEFKGAISKYVAHAKTAASELSVDTVINASKKIFKTAIAATGGIVSIFSFIAAFAVVPIYLYYMMTSNFDLFAKLERNLKFLPPDKREDILFFIRRFAEIMTTFFRGQLLIALIMGTLIGTGLMLVGVRFGFILGFCAGMLNLIPYLGTIIGLGVILPVSLFQNDGGWIHCGLSLAIFCAVQCLEGYVLTPKIMGDRTGLHPTVIIFSVFFWGIALHGILGMILAIPLTAFAVAAWDRISERWLSTRD